MNSKQPKRLKVGIFDSGVGGLSVLRAIHELLPGLDILYFADQAHVPYGRRPMQEIRQFSSEITRFLIKKEVDLVVVACNTASAASLKTLREEFTQIPIVGMEPAVKPASEISKTRSVGVLATPATFQGELYKSLVHRYGEGLQIHQNTCPGLVEEIEKGNLHNNKTYQILQDALQPMQQAHVDTIVLGCTHYPFVLPVIREICGSQITAIDPAPAIARRVRSLLPSQAQTQHSEAPGIAFYTSGNPEELQKQIMELLSIPATTHNVSWWDGKIKE
jgi:glutamate racemase